MDPRERGVHAFSTRHCIGLSTTMGRIFLTIVSIETNRTRSSLERSMLPKSHRIVQYPTVATLEEPQHLAALNSTFISRSCHSNTSRVLSSLSRKLAITFWVLWLHTMLALRVCTQVRRTDGWDLVACPHKFDKLMLLLVQWFDKFLWSKRVYNNRNA